MTIYWQIIIILTVISIIFFLLWRQTLLKIRDLNFRKNSLSSRYGKISEQFMPFLKNYPYLPERFRFIGSPIDGIQFEDNKIIFIEFKSADSNLSSNQKRIAELIWQKKIEFKEFRID